MMSRRSTGSSRGSMNEDGRFSVLLREVVQSPPFQQQRATADKDAAQPEPEQQAAADGSSAR